MALETETITEAPPEEAPPPPKRRSRAKAPEAKPEPASSEPAYALKVARGLSWMRFIYPFSFDAKEFDTLVKVINDGVVDEEGTQAHPHSDAGQVWNLVSWKQSSQGDDRTDDIGGGLLPHVARFLGEPQEYSRGHIPPRTAYMWSLDSDHLKHLLYPEDDIIWNLRLWRENIPFEVDDIQLAMFRHGVGFLTISARPTETGGREGSLDTWLNFMHGLRFLRGKPYAKVRARPPYVEPNPEDTTEEATEATTPTPTPISTRTYPPGGGLPPELPESWLQGSDIFRKLICPLLFTASTKELVWWEEVFVPGQLIPFMSLYVDRKPKAGPVPEADLYDLLYRLRNVVASRQHISMSSADRTFEHPDLLPYADFMWFYFSLSAGGFIAYNAPSTGPYRTSLPKKYLKEEYFLAFLLSLQQRFVLGVLTNKIAEHWLPSGGANKVDNWNWKKMLNRGNNSKNNSGSTQENNRTIQFDDLLENFLMFSARGNFVQLMQGEHHQLYYQKWQSKFQIKELFEEVQGELDAMHNYLEMEVQEHVNHILHVLTVLSIVLGIVGTIAGWWALNLDNISTSLAKWGWPNWLVWFSFLMIIPLTTIGIFFFRSIGWLPRRPTRR